MDRILKVLTSLHARLDRLEDTQNENMREVERKIEEVVEGKVKEYMEEKEKEKRKQEGGQPSVSPLEDRQRQDGQKGTPAG